MIISHKHKFIFLKTRKTAGSSVEMALAAHCGPSDIITPMRSEGRPGQNFVVRYQNWSLRDTVGAIKRLKKPVFYEHTPAANVKRWIGQQFWDDYFKFAIDRNPWARYVSQYDWNTRKGGEWEDSNMRAHFEHAESWRKSNWEIYAIGDRVIADCVIRYENLEEELAEITARLDLPKLELPRAKSKHRRKSTHYSKLIPPDLAEEIGRICAREIDYLGYGFEKEDS